MIMEYKVVKSYEIYNLEKEVKELITDGWIPLGGVCCTFLGQDYESDSVVLQAMTREEKSVNG